MVENKGERNSNFQCCEVVFEGDFEDAVEFEITIPDFLPDIERIVRVDATPVLTKTTPGTDVIDLEGDIALNVLYMPEQGRVLRCLSKNLTFSGSMEAPGVTEDSVVSASERLQHVNCRVLSPRKISVKVGLRVSVTAECTRIVPLIDLDFDDVKVETLSEPERFTRIIGRSEKRFHLSEEIHVPAGRSEIASFVKGDVVGFVSEAKTMGNKIITKGYAGISFLYVSDLDEGGLAELRSEIPFNQIIDMDGVDEESILAIEIRFTEAEFTTYQDSGGENRVISVDMEGSIWAVAYSTIEEGILKDAYAIDHSCKLEYGTIYAQRQTFVIESECTVDKIIEFEENCSELFCVSAFPIVLDSKEEDGELVVSGNINVSILGIFDGSIDNVDKMVPFECAMELPEGCERAEGTAKAKIRSCSYMSQTGEVRVEITLELSAVVRCAGKSSHVSGIELLDVGGDTSGDKFIVLYYTDDGENLFDIAKQFGTSQHSIMEANGLEGERIQKRVLLIPRGM